MITIMIAMSLSGCINPNSAGSETWTIMVYMSGDNDLSPFVTKNLDEMQSAGPSGGVNLLVLADQAGDSDSHLYKVWHKGLEDKGLLPIWLKRPDEASMGRSETLRSFLDWAMKNYTANHYLLVIWGHGSGWKGAAEDKDDWLNLSEMDAALEGKKLDIIGFDACNMGSLEVYYELEGHAKYIVASEKKVPKAGWPYGPIFTKIKGKTPVSAGKMIVDEYVKAYSNGSRDAENMSIVMALYQTATGLCEKFKAFTETMPVVNGSGALVFEDKDCSDIRSIINDEKVGAAIKKITVAVGRWNNPGCTMNVDGACGMAVYCPQGGFDQAYNDILMARETRWDERISIPG